jgi:hypothetical protein
VTAPEAQKALILAAILAPIGVLVLWGVARLRRGRSAVRAALERDGYEIVRIDHRVVRQGPLWPTTTRSQNVYRVVVRDASGRERTVWARWGKTWLLARDTVELRWDA